MFLGHELTVANLEPVFLLIEWATSLAVRYNMKHASLHFTFHQQVSAPQLQQPFPITVWCQFFWTAQQCTECPDASVHRSRPPRRPPRGGIGIAEVVAVLRGKFLADLAADGGFLMTNPFRVFDLDFVLKKNKMSKESSSLRGENRNPKCLSLAPQAE